MRERAQHASGGYTPRSRKGTKREAGPGACAFIGSVGGVLWSFQAKAGLVNSNQESKV